MSMKTIDTTVRTCARCKQIKPLDQFIKDNRRENGRGYCCNVCWNQDVKKRSGTPQAKSKIKTYAKTYREENKELIYEEKKQARKVGADFINQFRDVPCLDCKKRYPLSCMEFDHVRGTKLFPIANGKQRQKQKVLEEIAKCDVVCCICHRIRTHERRNKNKDRAAIKFLTWVNELKSKPCMDCNQCFDPVAMDFDHVRGTKKYNICAMQHRAKHKVIEEIAKCDLVCANCHRIRTDNRLKNRIT